MTVLFPLIYVTLVEHIHSFIPSFNELSAHYGRIVIGSVCMWWGRGGGELGAGRLSKSHLAPVLKGLHSVHSDLWGTAWKPVPGLASNKLYYLENKIR